MKTNYPWSENAKTRLRDCRPLVRRFIQRAAEKSARAMARPVLGEDMDAAIIVLSERLINPFCDPAPEPFFGGLPGEKPARIVTSTEQKAIVRRVRKMQPNIPGDSTSIPSFGATLLAGRYARLTHDQMCFMASLVASLASESWQEGYRKGLDDGHRMANELFSAGGAR